MYIVLERKSIPIVGYIDMIYDKQRRNGTYGYEYTWMYSTQIIGKTIKV